MKYSIISLFFLIFVSCKDAQKQTDQLVEKQKKELTKTADQKFFGEKFDISNQIESQKILSTYNQMKVGDTIEITFASKVNSVCKKKGCWMRLELPDGQETFVRFKDYGFFVPKDIENQTAIVHGKAFVQETSVEDLKHYAKDAGKSKEDIVAITEPELSYSFEADGVYLQ
ncbi:DUF4920 domain-containing protein [Flavobacterium sp. CS20]|jgi:hypothetical protein|uniref:DUF4920 domain-containing protein n=1 Tax=Flavobacterium sp. CS20 TaxID=2775246 RepID=UPI001B3A72E7|nr:DUF4920 domain-containing protein [Flavobacterium sp. CS20]QTY26031.1 DUF4920 domain-containing protein [Flavobacterium sp. CS20]